MKLKREIGKKSLILLTINAILGTGIFFLPAIGAIYAGPASIFSWILMSIVAITTSIYFAELLSMFPKSGGIYEYTKRAFGEFPAFIVGWTSWIAASITISMLIVGSIIYILPDANLLTRIIISISIILFFNYISYRGIRNSIKMVVFFGAVTILALSIIILGGFLNLDANSIGSITFTVQFPLIILSIYFISETFFGWETITYLAEEVRRPRIMPEILIISTVLVSIISLLLVFVALVNPNWQAFSLSAAPLVFLSSQFFGSKFASLFALLIFIPLIGTAASWIISSPRLLYAMSRDKVLVPTFSKVHKKYKTPHNAIAFQAVLTIIISIVGFASYTALLSLLLPLVLLMYSTVLLSVVKLRIDQPNLRRPFSAPFAKAVPIILVAFNVTLLYTWLTLQAALDVFLLGVFFILFGIPMYILIKLRNDRTFVEKFFNSISIIWDWSFQVWYSRPERRKIINKLNLKEGFRVLDFGAGSGITTMAIAKRVGRRGLVVAVDLSEKQLKKAMRKSRKMEYPNTIFIKSGKLRVKRNSFDAIAMVNVLEYLKYPRKELKNVFRYLKKGGRFSALSFGKSLGISAPESIGTKKNIEGLFRKAGMNVKVHRERKKFTEYWYIWGRKG